ncbi:MAG: hypothetical protein QCH31_03070 [Methanolobus sp.]|nr:hypothetical protein [Methanolobus sp.]
MFQKNEWSVSPSIPCSGDILDITGRAGPAEDIYMQVSFTMMIPVIDGEYSHVFENIRIPGGKNSFLVRTRKVRDLSFIVRMFVDFKRTFEENEGVAEFFEKDAPSGSYEIVIKGNAYQGEDEVRADFVATQTIRSDSDGNFHIKYNTTSLPEGEFIVKIGDNEKMITLMPPRSRVKKQSNIEKLMDKGFLFGFGLLGLAEERMEEITADLIGNIEEKKREGKQFITEVSERQKQDMKRAIHSDLNGSLDRIDLASKEDVKELMDTVKRLSEKIDRLNNEKHP